ncbi:MAG: site-specific DNA-methyltransferase [Bacteroidetes bacterium]|nr:site-specific DNA-methyltransferase [Bacteroidota bacterium]MCL5025661.1 site-specific DNA-methyltransferase [Chloroflexota bacterium]
MQTNIIYCQDARRMGEVDDGSVHLIVTSPPYNVGKPYLDHSDTMSMDEYLAFLLEVWQECRRVLCKGGRIAVNVASTGRQPYVPLHSFITQQLLALGLQMRGEIIWDKGASVGTSTAWGSFARASNPTLRDIHEYILVFSKDSPRLEMTCGESSGIANQDFVDWTRSIWRFRTEAGSTHPAPFPEELPRRLILLYTNYNDIVLDPFIGSGTTAVAARRLDRRYVGYEISPQYCAIAGERLQAMQAELPLEFRPDSRV